uniref:Ig-like domain-containing protein n=1 Tax=Callorhinchus milii TaxID=7868 RepID=A0A4W3GDV5_CALMI
ADWMIDMFLYELHPDASHQDSVAMKVSSISKREGDTVTIECTYSTHNTSYIIYWYRQYGDGIPEFIIWKYSGGNEAKADWAKSRFSVALLKSNTTVQLMVSQLQVADSARYHCALRLTQ